MAEKQKAMQIQGEALTLINVKVEEESVTHLIYSTKRTKIKVRDDKLEDIQRKVTKAKTTEDKDFLALKFVQSKIKPLKGVVFAKGEYDDEVEEIKIKLFGDF